MGVRLLGLTESAERATLELALPRRYALENVILVHSYFARNFTRLGIG